MRRSSAVAALAAIALVAVGCESPAPSAPDFNFATLPWGGTLPVPGNGITSPEQFQVCKSGGSATFDYSVTDNATGGVTNASITVQDGECWVIAVMGGVGETVTITESSAPAGYVFDHVTVETTTGAPPTGSTVTTQATPVVTGVVGGRLIGAPGITARYVNVFVPTEGGEGCTPGYWKQSQHFDSWPAPYTPTTPFGSVFEDAFPGKTLVQVLGAGGGGLNALGRHTVAALLSSANPNVSYDLTAAQVIAQFNALFPTATGSNESYNGLKDLFAGFNEQMCPIN